MSRTGFDGDRVCWVTMIDRHYGPLARDGREHAIELLDALNGARSRRVDAGGRSVDVGTGKRRQSGQRQPADSRLNSEAL